MRIGITGGALCNDALRAKLEAAVAKCQALLCVPSGRMKGISYAQ
jgi:hypothetical protein